MLLYEIKKIEIRFRKLSNLKNVDIVLSFRCYTSEKCTDVLIDQDLFLSHKISFKADSNVKFMVLMSALSIEETIDFCYLAQDHIVHFVLWPQAHGQTEVDIIHV